MEKYVEELKLMWRNGQICGGIDKYVDYA